MVVNDQSSLSGAPSVRHRMEMAIADCTCKYRLRLTGSWSTGEPHLPCAVNGTTHSFSDIDLIAIEEIAPTKQERARRLIADAAIEVGLVHSGISIRHERCFTGLPHACDWSPNTLSQLLRHGESPFLCFWTAISGIEAAVKIIRDRRRSAQGLAPYVVTKFFFTLIRNVALVSGEVLSTYRDVCKWISTRASEVPISELYRIKTGDLLEMEASWVEAMLGERMLKALLGRSETASTIARQVRAYFCESVPLDAAQYVRIAQKVVPDEAARQVVLYEMAKLEQAHSA